VHCELQLQLSTLLVCYLSSSAYFKDLLKVKGQPVAVSGLQSADVHWSTLWRHDIVPSAERQQILNHLLSMTNVVSLCTQRKRWFRNDSLRSGQAYKGTVSDSSLLSDLSI
jgi:hypothetical protein